VCNPAGTDGTLTVHWSQGRRTVMLAQRRGKDGLLLAQVIAQILDRFPSDTYRDGIDHIIRRILEEECPSRNE
jgi:hypothetical protein